LTTAELGTVRNGNPTGGSFTYTLPSAITVTNGKGVTIRHVGTANQINIAAVLAQTIDGLTTYVLRGQYESVELVSDGANWHIKNDANRSVYGGSLHPQGYLTLTSATPIITGDVASATAVYYTPFVGNLVPVYDGTRWAMKEFDELTLTLASQHALNTIYDVFVWLESGVLTIGTGPAWSVSTAGAGARGTGAGTTQLTRTKGMRLNTVAMTTRNGASTYTVAASRATYLGSIFIDGTAGQVTCHTSYGQSRKWGVWNAYNQAPIVLKAGDSTASWSYASTIRASDGTASNSLTIFSGLQEASFDLRFMQHRLLNTNGTSTTVTSIIGIGVDATATMSGFKGFAQCISGTASFQVDHTNAASHNLAPILGRSVITAIEDGTGSSGSGTVTYYGGEDDMQLTARWMG
jgi:hypothetical protein